MVSKHKLNRVIRLRMTRVCKYQMRRFSILETRQLRTQEFKSKVQIKRMFNVWKVGQIPDRAILGLGSHLEGAISRH